MASNCSAKKTKNKKTKLWPLFRSSGTATGDLYEEAYNPDAVILDLFIYCQGYVTSSAARSNLPTGTDRIIE